MSVGTPSGWVQRPLADLTTRITYGFTNPMPNAESGPWLVTAKDVNAGRIDYSTARHTTGSAYREMLTDKSRPRIGDVLLTKDGTIGRVAVCDRDDICINQSVALLQLKDSIDPAFLAYLLQSPSYQEKMAQDSGGSTIKHIYITRVDKMTVAIPDFTEQRAIAEVLGALDDKIAANAKLVSSAAELTKSLYVAMTRESDGHRAIASIVTLEYGKALPESSRRAGDVDVYGSGGLVGAHDVRMVKGPGVVVGRKGTAGAVHWAPRDFFPIDTTFYVRVVDPAASPIFCYYALRSARLDEMNSDSAVPGLNRNEAYQVRVPWPGPSAIERFTKQADPLANLSHQANSESQTLAELRDTLLPQLMSGKLRVGDAEKVVGGVV